MNMDQAAVFFAASILTAMGFLVWITAIVVVNNLVHKYWKSWGWKWMSIYPHQEPVRFMDHDEASRVAPSFEKTK